MNTENSVGISFVPLRISGKVKYRNRCRCFGGNFCTPLAKRNGIGLLFGQGKGVENSKLTSSATASPTFATSKAATNRRYSPISNVTSGETRPRRFLTSLISYSSIGSDLKLCRL